MPSNRISITPREAASLDRLLDAYLATVEPDDTPGYATLSKFRTKLAGLDMDHTEHEEN